MALKVQASFAGGELDPALHERTGFEKYQSGAKTARNVIVGKTGRFVSRSGRTLFKTCALENRAVRIFSPPNSNVLLEFGHLYAKLWDFDGNLLGEDTHTMTEDDLPNVKFEASKEYIWIFCASLTTLRLLISEGDDQGTFINTFFTPGAPHTYSVVENGTPGGYDCEYVATYIRDGQETLDSYTRYEELLEANIPIAAGQSVTLIWEVGISTQPVDWRPIDYTPTEMKVYRRPKGGGVFGFIGSTTKTDGFSVNRLKFEDLGQAADYTHNPPQGVVPEEVENGVPQWKAKVGRVYQQRLIVAVDFDEEALIASRTGYQNNFLRDFPLSSDGALQFKSGTSGYAKVLDMLDNDGLVVFTSVGIFLSTGALSPANLALDKKGNWVIDDKIPPLGVPGGAIFVDVSTNTIRQLSWSTEQASYSGTELSTFSNHLFTGKRVVSWGFEEGDLACLWAVLSDGTFASFTYEPEQQMFAWTRHDSGVDVEEVAATSVANKTFFVTKVGSQRYIEMTVPRYVSRATLDTDPEAYMGHSIASMDSMLSFRTKLNDSLTADGNFVLSPVEPDVWDGELELYSPNGAIFVDPGIGEVGNVFRFFAEDGSTINLEVMERIDDNNVIVRPDSEFPSEYSASATLYNTANSVSGLEHLEGESVAVMVDGYVVASPNNDDQNYAELIVEAGVLTLPNDMRGAIIHVGRPITNDIETLDIDTVEQRPVLIESQTVNKVYVKLHRSRGIYVANKFPDDDKVKTMQSTDQIDIDYEQENEILSNRFQAPTTKRHELTIPGDWKSNGRICLRNVDSTHFEVLSIIPDTEDLRR